MLVQEEKGGEGREDRLEREEEGGVGGREMLLSPALNRECGSGGQQAGNGECNEQTRGDGEVWPSCHG